VMWDDDLLPFAGGYAIRKFLPTTTKR